MLQELLQSSSDMWTSIEHFEHGMLTKINCFRSWGSDNIIVVNMSMYLPNS